MEKHIVFGVSPFNSKFNEEYVFDMLYWGFIHFNHVDVIHPHEETRYLLMGCGNDDIKSRRKSRKEFGKLSSIITKYTQLKGKRLAYGRAIMFADFYHSEIYLQNYHSAKIAFNSAPDFRQLCMAQTEKALLNRKKATDDDTPPDINSQNIAVEYVLREIPFIVSLAEILSSPCHVSFSYYTRWHIADYFNQYRNLPTSSRRTDFIVKDHAKAEDEPDRTDDAFKGIQYQPL